MINYKDISNINFDAVDKNEVKGKKAFDIEAVEESCTQVHEDFENDQHQIVLFRLQQLVSLIKNSTIIDENDNKSIEILIELLVKYEISNIIAQYIDYESHDACDMDEIIFEQAFNQIIQFIYQLSKMPKIVEGFLSEGRLFPILFDKFFNTSNSIDTDVSLDLFRCLINLCEDEGLQSDPFSCIIDINHWDLYRALLKREIPDILSAQFFYTIEKNCQPCFFNEMSIQQYLEFFITRISSETIYFIAGFIGIIIENDTSYGFGINLPQIQRFLFSIMHFYQTNGADSYKTMGSLAKLAMSICVNSDDTILDLIWKNCDIMGLIQAIIERYPYIKDTAFNLLRLISKHKYLIEEIGNTFESLGDLFNSCFDTDRVVEQEYSLRFIKSFVTRNTEAINALIDTDFVPWIEDILSAGSFPMQVRAMKLLLYTFDYINNYRKGEIVAFIEHMENEDINERFDEILDSGNEILIELVTTITNSINHILGE